MTLKLLLHVDDLFDICVIFQVITDHVYKLLEEEVKLKKHLIPVSEVSYQTCVNTK